VNCVYASSAEIILDMHIISFVTLENHVEMVSMQILLLEYDSYG